MTKVDHKKEIASYTARRGVFEVIDVPPLRYLAIDGAGDPNTAPAWRAAVEAIYPAAYALKFASRRELGLDYVVMPLEALWWADDMDAFTRARDKTRWSWTLLNLVPAHLDDGHVSRAIAAAAEKAGGPDAAAIADLRLVELEEGLSVQTLHVGSFDDEAPVLERLHDEFLPAEGLVMTGRHHEIYLSDARRTAPARLRTILRQPVARA